MGKYMDAKALLLGKLGYRPSLDLDCYVLQSDRNALNETLRQALSEWVDDCESDERELNPDHASDWISEAEDFWDMAVAVEELQEFVNCFDTSNDQFMDAVGEGGDLMECINRAYAYSVRDNCMSLFYHIVYNAEEDLAEIFDDEESDDEDEYEDEEEEETPPPVVQPPPNPTYSPSVEEYLNRG